MRHMLFTMLLTAFSGTAAFAGDPVNCTLGKMCKGPAECTDINAPMRLEMSEALAYLDFFKKRLTLDMVAGEPGSGITYAGKDTDDTFTVLTVQNDGSGFMSGHKLGLQGVLYTAYFNCEGVK